MVSGSLLCRRNLETLGTSRANGGDLKVARARPAAIWQLVFTHSPHDFDAGTESYSRNYTQQAQADIASRRAARPSRHDPRRRVLTRRQRTPVVGQAADAYPVIVFAIAGNPHELPTRRPVGASLRGYCGTAP